MRVKVSTFLYNFQQPKKEMDLAVYTILLHELKIPPQLVSNTHAKKILQEIYSDEEEEEETKKSRRNRKTSEQSSGRQSKDSGAKPAEPKNQTNKKTEQETKGKKWCLTIKKVKLLDILYSKSPASFGSSKRLQTTNDKSQNTFGNKTILQKISC